jgi:hypothetical protein
MTTKDTSVFTVFGGAYVTEHHNDNCINFEAEAARRRLGYGPYWLVASSLIVALTFCAAEILYFTRLGSGLL